tara:strand:+ start:12314 stop:13489 length:1176 start_codon:yes stop_codon:yes gene_type:complete
MNSILEPAARRIFDGYYRYCRKNGLDELQFVLDEAFKFNERLRKQYGNTSGLFDLDEFLLIKALRNHSAHRGDLEGEVFAIKRAFAQELNLELAKVCLISKETVNQAIDGEQKFKDVSKQQDKIRKIRGQLADFGDFYNLEPVIFNFIVKLYEKLIALKLPVSGDGFKEIDTAYKREIYFRYAHYVKVDAVEVDNTTLLVNLMPIAEAKLHEQVGLSNPSNDPWAGVGELDLDCTSLHLASFNADESKSFTDSIINRIVKDEDLFNIAMVVPNYIGIAFIKDTQNQESEFTCFSVNQQKALLEKADINIDEAIYDLGPFEILALFILEESIVPLVIVKQDLDSAHTALTKNIMEVNDLVEPSGKTSKVKNKRKMKTKRKLASAARKAQRKK